MYDVVRMFLGRILSELCLDSGIRVSVRNNFCNLRMCDNFLAQFSYFFANEIRGNPSSSRRTVVSEGQYGAPVCAAHSCIIVGIFQKSSNLLFLTSCPRLQSVRPPSSPVWKTASVITSASSRSFHWTSFQSLVETLNFFLVTLPGAPCPRTDTATASPPCW